MLLAASSPHPGSGSRRPLQFSVNTFPPRRSFARKTRRFSDLIAPRSVAALAPHLISVTLQPPAPLGPARPGPSAPEALSLAVSVPGLGPGLSSPEAPQAAHTRASPASHAAPLPGRSASPHLAGTLRLSPGGASPTAPVASCPARPRLTWSCPRRVLCYRESRAGAMSSLRRAGAPGTISNHSLLRGKRRGPALLCFSFKVLRL